MACLWTPKVTLSSSSVSFTIMYNICMCGSGYILKVLIYGAVMCEWIWGKRVQDTGDCVCVVCLSLSLAVSPYQAGGLTKARDPCQAVLDNCTWPECSWETRRDLKKLGLIRNTSPDLLSQSGIRPRCVYACMFFFLHTLCLILPQSRSHTDLFTPPWKWLRPRRPTGLAQ